MIIDRLNNWQRRFEGPIWSKAFQALEKLTADSPEGETLLQGQDLIMRVISYPTRTPQEAGLEAHRQYIDIQMALVNSERIDWFSTTGLTLKTPYDKTKDVMFFERPHAAPAHIDVFPGTFVVLFPEDAHMPQLMTGDASQTVKKVVIKVSLDQVGKTL